ncbi:MAG TPA: YaiO family outer membrane beta-barrel protein [Gemmatimonadales bacterium]|jgi:YaiO family outer membrane protein|nr:YaiO family outer membrane beta-barrel protein [Gemmatimonadales bacterium]
MKPWLAMTLGLLTLGGSAVAQAPAPGASWVEGGGFYHRVSGGFGDWKGGYLRGVFSGAHNVWYLDAKGQEAFHDRGVYGALANVHSFGSRVYTQLSAGGGTGTYVLPDLRLDAALAVKLGAARSVVATAGVTFVKAKAIYKDRAVSGGLVWYAGPAILELSGRINWSNPNAVRSERINGAVTLGKTGRSLVAIRAGAGTEGYQLTGVAATLRRFRSQEAGLTWRQWMSSRFGLVLGGELYHNPFYTRTGVSLGLFRGW